MTILCAYDKEYYMRRISRDTVTVNNLLSSSLFLPEEVVLFVRKFPVLTILSLVRPTVQSETRCPGRSVISATQHCHCEVTRSNPSSYSMVLSTSCVLLNSLLR